MLILLSYSPKLVADAVLLLVQDTSKAGAIARVTPRNGIDFHKFDKKPLFFSFAKTMKFVYIMQLHVSNIADPVRYNVQ